MPPNRFIGSIVTFVAWTACSQPKSTDTNTTTDLTPLPTETTEDAVHPPVPPEVAIEPANPTTADDLWWVTTTEAFDEDGDAITTFVSWFRDGVPETAWTDHVPAEATQKGEVWEARITVTDGMFTAPTALAVAVIGNTPPTATVTLSPESPTTVSHLVATVSGSDVDNDPLGFQVSWTVDGTPTDLYGFEVPAERTRSGETWEVTVVPVDPDEAGAPVSAATTIRNAAPRVTAIEVLPNPADTTDILTAHIAATDSDEDDIALVIQWWIDGMAVPGATDSTLAPSLTARGNRIEVEVSADDGEVVGAAMWSDVIIIENSLPTITNVVISPSSPTTNDEVTCIPEGWQDDDGDAESYVYQWTLDGVAGPSTPHWHLSTSGAVAGQTVGCTVIPEDGLDLGPPVVASAVLSPP